MNQDQANNLSIEPETKISAASHSPVPTIKVLAIGHLTPKGIADRGPVMHREVPATVRLYLEGKIDNWFSKIDQTGVVFIINAATTEEAHKLLATLPLSEAGMMEFELIALGPLNPLRSLLP